MFEFGDASAVDVALLRLDAASEATPGFFVHGCALHRRKFLLQRHLATMRLGDDVSHQRVG